MSGWGSDSDSEASWEGIAGTPAQQPMGTAAQARESARQELSSAAERSSLSPPQPPLSPQPPQQPQQPQQHPPTSVSPDELRYGPKGQWALEGDALREHLADERRRELKLKQKREKKKALAARAAVQRLANPDADGRLQEYTEKQALRKRVKQEHGDTHIHGPTQAVHVSVYADVGIGRGDKPGRDWYEGGRGTGAGGGKNKKPTPVVFGSGIAASAVRGTAPEDRVGGAGHGPRKVRRADYAPPLPRVARVAIGTDDGEELAGYNRHARQPAQKAAALANAGLGVKDGPEAPTGGAATASSRVQGVRAKGRNVRGAGGRGGGGESGATAMARDDAMRRIRELEASTRQQESVFQAAMGAVNEQLRSPSTIVAGVKDKETAAGLLEALREIAVAQHNRAVDAEAKQKRLLEEAAATAAATARAAAERVPGGAEVQQLRVDLAACKKTSSQRLARLNQTLAANEVLAAKVDLAEVEG